MGGAFLVLIEVWFDLLPSYPKILLGTQYGYSVFSFLIIYLLARAIRLYGLPNIFKKLSPFIYVGCSFALGFFAFFCQKTGHGDALKIVFAYSNPVVILSSIAFLIMFERMSFHSDIINHISKSTLACLLGHTSIVSFYTKHFKYLYDHYSGCELAGFWTMAIVIVFLTSIIIDQLRLLLWKPLNTWLITRIKNNYLF